MFLNFSNLEQSMDQEPILRLQTMAGKDLGVIPYVKNLVFEINYSEVSTIRFEVAACSNGKPNPLYDQIESYKVVYTDSYGIYILTSPKKTGDGIKETKSVSGYSIEKLFEKKLLYLAEGTYDFWNVDKPADTVLGRILELDPSWSVGYVVPKLVGCYRTFDEYNDNPLSFCYNAAAEKYQCTFVFDVYEKKIHVYDSNQDAPSIGVYLSYDNLIEKLNVEELTDGIVTKLHVFGADDLTIYDVNPTGKNYLVDLSYFINNGDLDLIPTGSTEKLSDKVQKWEKEIRSSKTRYTSLVAARSVRTAKKIALSVELGELEKEKEGLITQQSVAVQSAALGNDEKENLKKYTKAITDKSTEITAKENEIKAIDEEIKYYQGLIGDIAKRLSPEGEGSYFTAEEQKILNRYLISKTISEGTFVSTNLNTDVSGMTFKISGKISVSNAKVTRTYLDDEEKKEIYSIHGGKISSVNNPTMDCAIQNGTFERNKSTNSYILSIHTGSGKISGKDFENGTITVYGACTSLSDDIGAVTDQDVTEHLGTKLEISTSDSEMFITAEASEYQKYSVAQDLYDFGVEALRDSSWPVYEFTVDSANFLYQNEFLPFQREMRLGNAIHLDMGNGTVRDAVAIGVTFDFENPGNFKLMFSNKFRLRNGAERVKNEISHASSSGSRFDAKKYLYNQASNKSTEIDRFMKGQLDAAKNTIIGAENQSVRIDGAGIHISSGDPNDSMHHMRIVNNMIVMTSDNWQTASMAIGKFGTSENSTIQEHWGVNAEIIAGRLLVGNSLVLENATDDGSMMFKVDQTGAWLNNSRFILQSGQAAGGKILIDPRYGIAAGNGELFTTEGTTVTPKFDESGTLEPAKDKDGFPLNTNFYLDIRDGNAYFRGKIYATDGYFKGELEATSGTFKGTLSAAKLIGNLEAEDGQEGWLVGCGIKVGKNDKAPNKYNFYVDRQGNVNINGGTISFNSLDQSTQDTINGASGAATAAGEAAAAAGTAAAEANKAAVVAGEDVLKLAQGEYTSGGTSFINGKTIYGPEIHSNSFKIHPKVSRDSEGNPTNDVKEGSFGWLGCWDGSEREVMTLSYSGGKVDFPTITLSGGNVSSEFWMNAVTRFQKAVQMLGSTSLGDTQISDNSKVVIGSGCKINFGNAEISNFKGAATFG